MPKVSLYNWTSSAGPPGSEPQKLQVAGLTLRLQPVDDGGGGEEDGRAQAADALLGRLTHAAQVPVGVFGAGVDGGHQAVSGAHQGQAADPLHQVLLRDTNYGITEPNYFRFLSVKF